MMTCAEAREALLEADLAELRGEGTSPLARHLVSCAECRRAAAHVLEETARLDAALAPRTPHRAPRPAPRAPRTARRALPLGLAAAAALALFFALPRGDESLRPTVSTSGQAPADSPLDLSSGSRTAAVFKTADPNITVVWFF